MCTVSMVGDYFRDRTLPEKYPNWVDYRVPEVSQYEFQKLKKDVEELKKLLLAAKKYDEAVGEPDCEVDDKVELIKKIAAMVGVDMSEVFGKEYGVEVIEVK